MSSFSAFQDSTLISIYAATKAFKVLLAERFWEEFYRVCTQVENLEISGADIMNEKVIPLHQRKLDWFFIVFFLSTCFSSRIS